MSDHTHNKNNSLTLNGKIEIFPNKPLPQYDCGDNRAFAAKVLNDSGGNYYAVVCAPHSLPRYREVERYQTMQNRALAQLVYAGAAYIEPEEGQRNVFVYADMGGQPCVDQRTNIKYPLKESAILQRVIPTLVSILQDMRNKDFVHGHINAHNLQAFDVSGKEGSVILGDTLSCPYFYAQPSEYLPIPQIMAQKNGRSRPTFSDDLYAFGVTIAALLRSHNPLKGLDDHEIINRKMEVGTYQAIIGKERLTGSILELLRGVLHDDPAQQWDLEEVLLWMDGQRLSPKQGARPIKAQRPIKFLGKEYTNPRLLALDMQENRVEVERVVDSRELPQWLERSLNTQDYFKTYTKFLEVAESMGRGAGFQDKLVTYLSMALDQNAPLRYRDLAVFPDGVGNALFSTMVLQNDLTSYQDLMATNLVLNWITMREDAHVDYSHVVGKFDKCRMLLRQTKSGYGVERCLYYLASDANCISPILNGYIVRDMEDMMHAFENLAKRGKISTLFLDRHSIAFLCERDPKVIENSLYDLDGINEAQKLIGNLHVLGAAQVRMGKQTFPEIGQVFLRNQQKLFSKYRDKTRVDGLSKKLKKYAESGDIKAMLDLVANDTWIKEDEQSYKAAMAEYKVLNAEHNELSAKLEDGAVFENVSAKNATAIVACIFCVLVILIIVVLMLTETSSLFA